MNSLGNLGKPCYNLVYRDIQCDRISSGIIQCDKISTNKYDFERSLDCLIEENRKMNLKIIDLRKELDDLKTHVEYMPGGVGYQNAEKHFNDNSLKVEHSLIVNENEQYCQSLSLFFKYTRIIIKTIRRLGTEIGYTKICINNHMFPFEGDKKIIHPDITVDLAPSKYASVFIISGSFEITYDNADI